MIKSVSNALNYHNRFNVFLPTKKSNCLFGCDFLGLARKYPLLWSWLLDLTVPEAVQREILAEANNTYGLENNLVQPNPNNNVDVNVTTTNQNNNQPKIYPWNMTNVIKYLKQNKIIPKDSNENLFQNIYTEQGKLKAQIGSLMRQNLQLQTQLTKYQNQVNLGGKTFEWINPKDDVGFGTISNEEMLRRNPNRMNQIPTSMSWQNHPTMSQSQAISEAKWNAMFNNHNNNNINPLQYFTTTNL